MQFHVFVKSAIIDSRYAHFFATGLTGVLLNLLVAWTLTEFIFGVERYFVGYLAGAAVNVTYNFTLHTIMTFRTKKRHVRRFMLFILYSALSAGVQIAVVKTVTDAIGKEYYLIVIASTIFFLSLVSFLFFKYLLFNEVLRRQTLPRSSPP